MVLKKHRFYERRRARLRGRLSAAKVDAFVTFEAADVIYLTGFPSEGCFLLLHEKGAALFAPPLLAEHARAWVRDQRGIAVVEDRRLLEALRLKLKSWRAKTLGFDSEKVTVSLHGALQKLGFRGSALAEFVLRQRAVKDALELSHIRRACRITHRSACRAFELLRSGQSEQEMAHLIESLFREGGAPKPAFETIVAFGENAAYPHHVVGPKKFRGNTVVLTDIGCTVESYRSDLTRTRYYGKIPAKFKKVYQIVQESQQAGIAAVREGIPAGQVDFVCREIIRKAGYGDYFIHGTGHGVGLDIHEPPRLGIGVKDPLRAGMVVTVEPGIYLPGEFGVRIEDTLLVTKGGCEILTK